MIIVNSLGYSDAYSFLTHAQGDGCTLADLVFPFFLVIMGASLVQKKANFKYILQRAAGIFILGLLLNMLPNHWNWHTLRLPGVLQRIAICYLVCACIKCYITLSGQILCMFGLLMAYALIIGLCGTTAVAQIDEMIFSSAHLYSAHFDPEGLLSTIPAVSSVLFGHLLGYIFQQKMSRTDKISQIIFLGLTFCLLGWIWHYFWPFNKSIWSSSYVLWTAGLAYLAWVACDVWGGHLGLGFKLLGQHPLSVYFLHVFGLKYLMWIKIDVHGALIPLKIFLTNALFGWLLNNNASLAFALCYAFLWMLAILMFEFLKKEYFHDVAR